MTKAWLWALRGREIEKKQIAARLHAVSEELSAPKSPSLSGMPHGSTVGRNVEDAALRLAEQESIYARYLADLAEDEAKLERAMHALRPIERVIVRERYMHARTWDGVADTAGYSVKQTLRIHGALLFKLQNVEV